MSRTPLDPMLLAMADGARRHQPATRVVGDCPASLAVERVCHAECGCAR